MLAAHSMTCWLSRGSDANWFEIALLQPDHGHIDDALALFQTARSVCCYLSSAHMTAQTKAPSES